MTAASTALPPEEAERLCLDGIDLVDLYSAGETGIDLSALGGDTAVESLALYAQLLEATVLTLYAGARQPTDVPSIREAARESAKAWRGRVTS